MFLCWFVYWFFGLLSQYCPSCLRASQLKLQQGMVTLAVGQGVTGNTGMNGCLIPSSSRWHRWVHWRAPKVKPPMPGCRSSRRCLSPAPTPDSSLCRWLLHSSQTNLKGAKKKKREHWIILIRSCLSGVLCSLYPELDPVWWWRQAGHSFPERTHPCYITVFDACWNPACTLQAFPASTHFPYLTWHGLFLRPPHHQPSWHFNLHSWLCSQCHSCLAEWAPGYQEMHWHGIERKPGILLKGCQEKHNRLAVQSRPKGMKHNRQVEHKRHYLLGSALNLILSHRWCGVIIHCVTV